MRLCAKISAILLLTAGLLAAPIPTASAANFDAVLSGSNETPPVATATDGTAQVTVKKIRNSTKYKVCWSVQFEDFVSAVQVAHIHAGRGGVDGPVRITLWTGDLASPQNGCKKVSRGLGRSLLRDPVAFYINVYTVDEPDGEIRGQIGAVPGVDFEAHMNGAKEKPNPVDTLGTGDAHFKVDVANGKVCFTIAFANLSSATTAAHIHEGDINTAGGIVVTLVNGSFLSPRSACVPEDTPAAGKIAAIAANPQNFYCNVHTATHTGGEIRGQLENTT